MSPSPCPHCGFELTPYELHYCHSCYQPLQRPIGCREMAYPAPGGRLLHAALGCLGVAVVLGVLWWIF